jgi:hypothetical protein
LAFSAARAVSSATKTATASADLAVRRAAKERATRHAAPAPTMAVTSARKLFQAMRRHQSVQRRCQVGHGIDQRAVEVEQGHSAGAARSSRPATRMFPTDTKIERQSF